MRKRFTAVLFAAIVAVVLPPNVSFAAAGPAIRSLIAKAHSQRVSDTDIAISGDLAGLPSGSARYLSREDLLTLPLVTYSVNDDPNFKGSTEITGVLLEELSLALSGDPAADLVVAVCDDRYHAHYPRAYIADHHPLLVLKVNGQPPDRWPKDAEGQGHSMGPFMISHKRFDSNREISTRHEESQIPWGVVGLEFQNEESFLAAIAPRRSGSDPQVQAGFRAAQQNCLRCHNLGEEGGQKARHPWLVLSAWATAAPEHFATYVHNPRAENPHAEMPANPNYDQATLQALIAYFRTFQSREKP